MPLPIAPLALAAVKYGTVAAAAYTAAKRIQPGYTDQSGEDALERTPQGVTFHRPRDCKGQANSTARWTRVIRMGRNGPAISIDVAGIARIKVKRVCA